MDFTNKSRFDDRLVCSIFNWGMHHLDVQPSAVKVLRVYDYDRVFRGTAFRAKRQIIARVQYTAKPYPKAHVYPGRRNAPKFILRDCYDGLAYVLFHELGHFLDWQLGNPRTRDREQRVERLHKPVYERWQDTRGDLFRMFGEDWGFKADAGVQPTGHIGHFMPVADLRKLVGVG